jgi:hypothetical protein
MIRLKHLHRLASSSGSGSLRNLRLEESRWDAEASYSCLVIKTLDEIPWPDSFGLEERANLESKVHRRYVEGDYAQSLEGLLAQLCVLGHNQIDWTETPMYKDIGIKSGAAADNGMEEAIVLEQKNSECDARAEAERGS